MLHLWLCADRKANTERILNEVCRKARDGETGLLLMVPDQFSHMTERMLCRRGGAAISASAEVLGFSRLATRVFSQVGGCAEGETDTAGRLLTMALAVEQVRSRLKIYGNSASKPEFLLQLLDMLDEFRSFCITAERLRQAGRELTGVLAEKAEEFALLMESWNTVCARMGQNPETRLNRLLQALELSDFARGKQFYFDGFTDFNGVETEIIAQLLNKDAEVTVALQCPDTVPHGQQFAAAAQTVQRLLRLTQTQSVAVKTERFPAQTSGALSVLRRQLFSGKLAPETAAVEEIVFLHGGDMVEECRTAAAEILRLVSQGARWRDISVACADFNAYQPVLESIFRRGEIPAYFAGATDILRQPVAHMLLTALEAATGGMETETVLAYLKSGFVPLEREHCDRLENYVLLWNITGSRWEQPWTMNPMGFRRKMDDRGQALLTQLNADRERAVAPLLALRQALQSSKNTGQMVLALHTFLEEISLRETLNTHAQDSFAAGGLQKAQEYVQIYGTICDLMEQMYGVLGESVRSPEDFFRMFRTALSQCAVGTIPASLDCVTVGGLMSQRRCDTPYVFLLGAREGVFPSAQSGRSLLTDSERQDLTALGLSLAPTTAGNLEREFAAIDSVLSAPEKRLYLGAPEGTAAYLLQRAAEIFPNARRLSGDEALFSHARREYLERLVSAPGLRLHAPEDLAVQAARLSDAAHYRCGALSRRSVEALYGTELRLSSTKVDELAACRFSYFMKYGLMAKPRESAEVDASLYGSFVHDVLEKTGRQVMAEGGFHRVPLERVLQIAETEMEAYTTRELAELWQSSRAEYLFRRNFSEVRLVVEELYRELSASKFEPRWFELRFSSRGALPCVKIAGEEMTALLEGMVDRADLWRSGETTYVRIVDYKTGHQSMDYTKIYNGLGLQMLLYLFTLEQAGDALLATRPAAAGVLYFPARVDKVTLQDKTSEKEMDAARRKSRRRSGLLLEDEAVLQAMEPCEGKPELLTYAYDKEHNLTGDLFTPSQLHALERHVFSTVAALGDDLYRGNVEPNPYFCDGRTNACAWCDYTTVCRQKGQERWLEKIKTPKEFWEKLEVEHHE